MGFRKKCSLELCWTFETTPCQCVACGHWHDAPGECLTVLHTSLLAVLMRHSQAQLKTWLEGVASKSRLVPAIKLAANYLVWLFFFFWMVNLFHRMLSVCTCECFVQRKYFFFSFILFIFDSQFSNRNLYLLNSTFITQICTSITHRIFIVLRQGCFILLVFICAGHCGPRSI